ncbi:24781_t:CDS:1, partial [Gigaspora margarita]
LSVFTLTLTKNETTDNNCKDGSKRSVNVNKPLPIMKMLKEEL